MGKVAPSWKCSSGLSDESADRVRKKKRKKDLEEIRQNALAAKRNQSKGRAVTSQKTQTTLMKTLNSFASRRQEIENITQTRNLLLKTSTSLDDQIPKPLRLEGFFRAGIKGKQITRHLSASEERFRNAVLQGDALQILQSGNYHYSSTKEQEKEQPKNGIDSQSRMEIARFLKDSSESSYDVDGLSSVEKPVKSSPVLGGIKSYKKKSKCETALKNVSNKNNQSPKNKQNPKEEKCKRHLFVNENTNVDNKNISSYNHSNVDAIRFSPTKSTPENIIYYTEHIPSKSMDNNLNKNQNKINPSDPHLIKSYITNCKIIAKRELRGIFSDIFKDPMETAKAALKTTYMKAFKDDIHHQKETNKGPYSAESRITGSSGSEIMIEPDSAIARTLKRNSELQMKSVTWFSENKSDSSIDDIDNLKTGFPTEKVTVENNHMKRKRAPSSSKGENSEIEFPSSMKANVDPKSVRIETKMDYIQPERQELIARYLKDVKTNSKKDQERVLNNPKYITRECNNNLLEKEKLFISDNPKRTFLIHKSTKHVPSILRKNRSLVDCVEKEKIRLTIEKSQMPDQTMNKTLFQESTFDNNSNSEHTPNYGSTIPNQLIEAPKCKYTYMNAKYNQPPRIQIPLLHNNRFQRNSIPERHLFPSPKNVKKDFVIPQNFEPSPVEQLNFSQENYDLHKHHELSQENSEQDRNCMTRMVSFGDIQEKTDRLTLRSSQGQNCSQENVGNLYSSQEQFNPYPNFYYQQYDSSNNCMAHNNSAATFNEIPTSQSFNVALNSSCNYHPHNATKYKEDPLYISNNQYQIMPTKDYSSQRLNDFNCCLSNDHQIYRNQNIQQQNQEPVMSCVPVQQSNIRQPVKYIAIEENRIAQRRPIYGANDINSCTHTHKKSIANQQFTQVLKPCYTRDVLNQQCYAIPSVSSIQLPEQNTSQSLVISNYEIENIRKVNNVVPNVQRSFSLSNEVPVLNRNLINFVPSNTSDQSFIAQRVPVQAAVNNQRYVGQQMQMRMPSPMYSQVGYKHNHCSNSEVYKMNEVYLQKMNRNIHFERP